MRTFSWFFLLVTPMLPVTTFAQESSPYSVSANVAIATEYIFRGISQTNENPAIQGGFDGAYALGGNVDLYAGVWASNVDFAENVGSTPDEAVDEASTEMDFYGGFTGAVPTVEGLTWDAGVIYYLYPGAADSLDYDFIEGYGGLGYTFTDGAFQPEFGVKVSYSPDYFAASGDAIYAEGSVGLSLPYNLGLGLHIGYQDIDDNDAFGTPDYFDWSIGVSKEIIGLDLSLAYVDTDLDEEECFGGSELCEARVLFTAAKTF